MASVYSVGQINAYIKNMFRQDFLLARVSVKGEVSNCKYHTSGHVYFSLKDETGVIRCVLFAGSRQAVSFRLENGQSVIVDGSVSVYERDGSYQLYARNIRQDGLGELFERFEKLKRQLEEMGMFSPEYKKPVPKYIRTLGVVTAPTGAAVRDIIQISRRRNPGIRILVCPARVQGEGAAESIARGIMMLEHAGVDVIIAGRGGGSYEDLWAFNEELVARTIFECSVPVISAVGHETDTVISDFVADLRAPTPSAAAELAVADMSEVLFALTQTKQTLLLRMERLSARCRDGLEKRRLQLKLHGPFGRLNEARHHLSRLEDLLDRSVRQRLEMSSADLARRRERMIMLMQRHLRDEIHALALYREKLGALSPAAKLSAGYALVSDRNGNRITSALAAREAGRLSLWFGDGNVDVKVTGGEDGKDDKSDQ